jgi:DNA-binding response OmpR family regulator
VLVVDDDADIGVVLRSLLQRAGLRSVVTRTAQQALDALSGVSPDLVVLDLSLPDMDGLELLPHLRRLSPAPVLLLSARARDEDRAAGLGRGADDYVTKPFDNADLVSRCLALVERAPATGPGRDQPHDAGDGDDL